MLRKSSFLEFLSSQPVPPGLCVTERVRRGSSSCHMELMAFYGVSGFQLLQKNLKQLNLGSSSGRTKAAAS